ncbi:YvcK family protein [Patescibacteria group bacterium]|nr:YvcK family protein [Patescibacteria group bacterium]
MENIKKSKIVVLGGGTGTFTTLSGLKVHDVDLTAVVSIADDGGSTGRLRDELGVLPPGDIRQCLVALASGDDALRHLFNYRFSEGSLDGHHFGNLFLSALEKIYGNPIQAISAAHRVLNVRGKVIPVSAQSSNLFAELEDGTVVEGEHAIDVKDNQRAKIRECFLDPVVIANPEALDAIREADAIILAPGDLYTSLIPVLLVQGVAEAISECKGPVIYVLNLVAKPGQTDGYTAQKFIEKLKTYISPAKVDVAIVNSAEIPEAVLVRYTKVGEHIIKDDLNGECKVYREDVLAEKIARPIAGDRLERSLLRHDSAKLAKVIINIIKSFGTLRG